MGSIFHDTNGDGASLEGPACFGGDEVDVDLGDGQVFGREFLSCHCGCQDNGGLFWRERLV